MKDLEALTAPDLRAHPVWRYYGGVRGDANARIEPVDVASLSEGDAEVCIAATHFVLGDGTVCSGYCSPQDSSGLDYVQPVIATEHGHVRLWFDEAHSHEAESEWWKRFHGRASAVFPISYECLVPVDGAKVRGVIQRGDVFREAT